MITTVMRTGGISTNGIKSNITLNREIMKACKANNLYSNYLMIYSKMHYNLFVEYFYLVFSTNKQTF